MHSHEKERENNNKHTIKLKKYFRLASKWAGEVGVAVPSSSIVG